MSPSIKLSERTSSDVGSAEGEVLLAVDGLSVYFGGLKANHSISFQVKRGQIFGLVGPNGAGKSTCFNAICGVYRPTAGNIRFKGADIHHLPAYEVAKVGIGRTFQLTSLFLGLTALENVIIGLHLTRPSGFWSSFVGTRSNRADGTIAQKKALEVLSWVDLEPFAHREAGILNFAAQRRLEIAVAIAAKPELLLLDEPAAGMNAAEADDLLVLVRRLRDANISILLIEHNMRFVMSLCQHICVLNYGEKFAEGQPKEIAAHPGVREIYLGVDYDDA